MKPNVFYSGVGLVSLVLACSGAASDDPSDPRDGNLGEATEAFRIHGRNGAAQPSTPVGGPAGSGNGSSSGSSGNSQGPSYPPQPSGSVPGCSGPATPVSCPASCPVIDICRVCSDGSCGVPHVACNSDGSCGAVTFECEAAYEPCGGKRDGDTCTICDPQDPECVEDASLKSCHGGVCGASAVRCPEQCPVIAICQLCPDDSCADAVVACNPDGSCGNVKFTCN
ncbi:MAG: hypothetical protein ABI895_13180 [Deltaproteobacteria bacterium]